MNNRSFFSRGRFLLIALLAMLTLLWGCGGDAATPVPPTATSAPAATATIELKPTATNPPPPTNTIAPTSTTAPLPTSTTAPLPTNTTAPAASPTPAAEPTTSIGDLNPRLYEGSKLEFNITYPGDWEVSEVPDQTKPDTDGQVQILRPGTNGNVGLVVISSKLDTALSSKDALAAVANSFSSNGSYTNVISQSTQMTLGNADTDAAHIEYDWSGQHMVVDATALVQGDRSYAVLAVSPDTDYDANKDLFASAFASFEPLAVSTDFETYTAKDGIVSISRPKTWPLDDSDPEYTVFAAPNGDALIIFNASDQKTVFDDAAFDAYIKKFLADNFETSEGYKFNNTEKQADGSIRVSFDITGPNKNTWQSNGFFEQRGTIVVFSLFSADQDKWESYRDLFATVANSIAVDEKALNATKSIVTEQFDDANVAFTTLAPKGWEHQANDDNTIVYWTAPDGDGTMMVQVDDSAGLATDYFKTEQNAIDYINSIYDSEPDYKIGATTLQPDGSMRVDWTMTGVNGNPWQGEGFLEVREQNGKDLIVVQLISADTGVWEQYLPGFNDILNSLTLR